MDLKVNDVSGVTQTQEVNQTKPTDDDLSSPWRVPSMMRN